LASSGSVSGPTCALGLAGSRSAVAFGLILTVAPLLAVLAVITTAPGEVTMRVVTAYAAGCATVAVVLAIVLVRHSPVTGQHARGRAPAWPTANQ
jgi:hypothetical protein